jgi:hypothetical protein
MSARTAPLHSPAELAFHGCDDASGIVAYLAPSAHDATRVNTCALDTATGHILCDCKGAECGRVCWHADHIAAAWLASSAMLEVRWLSDAQLFRYGRKYAHLTATYRARIGRARSEDVIALTAARCEWRRRRAAARPALLALPLAA